GGGGSPPPPQRWVSTKSNCPAATISPRRRCHTRRRTARPMTAASSPPSSMRHWPRPIGRGLRFARRKAANVRDGGHIRFEPNGDVTIITGTLDYGQGHWTPFVQVLHQQLGVPFDRI